MEIRAKLQSWVNYHEIKQQKYGVFFLILIALAFVLGDWTFNYFSFAEFILIGIIPILFILGQIRINFIQLKLLLIVISLIFMNSLLRLIMGIEPFYTRIIVQASIKLIFYLFVVACLYNYIKRNKFEDKFLAINNFLSVVVIVIGIYIVVSIYNEHEYPYRLLWTFTRQDYKSYYFSGQSDFIRMRSIFSEPAHLGHYLMIILTSNLMYKKIDMKRAIFLTVVSLGVFLTFSYSMVFTLLVIIGLYFIKNIDIKTINKKYIITIGLILTGILFIFSSYIYETLIMRTLNIITGVDTSGFNRLVESWAYVDSSRWWIGNGINHTPVITNNFAYMLSDLGIFGFIPFILFTVWTIRKSVLMGILFILLNISRGGYLGPSLWFLVLFILIYNDNHSHSDKKMLGGPHHEETI